MTRTVLLHCPILFAEIRTADSQSDLRIFVIVMTNGKIYRKKPQYDALSWHCKLYQLVPLYLPSQT